jgi:hypothetical protein
MSEQSRKVAISTHPVITRPPRLSKGKILPKAVWDFEHHCLNYFVHAKGGVPDDARVARILSSFEDFLVCDWAATDRVRLITLTFEQFMSEFRTRWLPFGWESQLRTELLRARFDPKKISFRSWANQVQVLNAYLRGTSSHLDDDSMRFHIQRSIDPELQLLVGEYANEMTELHLWIAKVVSLDDRRRDEEKRMREVFDQMMSARDRQLGSSSRNTRIK